MTACSVPVPFGSPEDRVRIQQDLGLEQPPSMSVLIPLKWTLFDYGVEQKVPPAADTVALVQPGVLTLIGYENGHYTREAEFPSASVDCLYIFKGPSSAQPLWLLKSGRPVLFHIGDGRGFVITALREKLIDRMAAAGFQIHSDAQGKAYEPTGVSNTRLVYASVYGGHTESVAEERYYNVCAKK